MTTVLMIDDDEPLLATVHEFFQQNCARSTICRAIELWTIGGNHPPREPPGHSDSGRLPGLSSQGNEAHSLSGSTFGRIGFVRSSFTPQETSTLSRPLRKTIHSFARSQKAQIPNSRF